MRRAIAALLLVVAAAACRRQEPAPAGDGGAAEAARALAAIVATAAATGGEVQVRRGGQGDWQPVSVGAVLRAGDVVRTGAGAFARVEFTAGGGLELEERAEVLIDLAPPAAAVPGAAAPAGESRVSVQAGVVRGYVPSTPGAAPLVIRTAEGRDVRLAATPGAKPVAVRLTRGARGTEVAVTSGEVRIAGAGGETRLGAGQAAALGEEGAGAVTDLLAFPRSVEPGIDARFRFEGALAIRLAWTPVVGAAGYRVQVARDLAFHAVEETFDVAIGEVTFLPREEGVYAWRVASRDAEGLLGEYGFARRIYCEREQPQDLLVGPPDGHVVRFADAPPVVEFTWQSAADAAAYKLVVASGPDLLRDKVLELETSGQKLEVASLAPGAYHWGVFVKDPNVPIPIFVRARQLQVQKVGPVKVRVPKAIREWGR